MKSYIPILISLHIFGWILFAVLFVTSCLMLKKWKFKILVITISAILVCDSHIRLWYMIFSYGTFRLSVPDVLSIIFSCSGFEWLGKAGGLRHTISFLSLIYAFEMYTLICGSVKSSQYCKFLIIVVYAILAFLAEFGVPFSFQITNYEYCSQENQNHKYSTCTATLISVFCKHSIQAFGLVTHVYLVVGINRRLNTSIVLLKTFEKTDKIMNCERIKKFNNSTLVSQLVFEMTDFLCDLCTAIEAIVCISGYDKQTIRFKTMAYLFFIIHDVLYSFRLSVIIATQISFPIFHFMFLPSFRKCFRNCCKCKAQQV